MFSSLKLSMKGRRAAECSPPPPDLTTPTTTPDRPTVTTNRRSHKWSIDRAFCPGISDKNEDVKTKSQSERDLEGNHQKQDNKDVIISNNKNNEMDYHSYDCLEEEQPHCVRVMTRTMNVSIQRDSSGSLGITLRGGAHPDPNLSQPLTITQIKPGGPADREGTIKVGDRLLSVDGHRLDSVTLSVAQSKLRATGSPLSVLCVEYDVSVMSVVRAAPGPLLVEIEGPHCHDLGLELVNTPDNSAVVIGHVRPGSIAERCGALMPGDQILGVNNINVEDTKMMAEDVNKLLWAENCCVLQILPSNSYSIRGFSHPFYSCPSPSQSSKHSREHHSDKNQFSRSQSPLMKRLENSSTSLPESEVEANVNGVYQRKNLSISLSCDAHGKFGLTVGPSSKGGLSVCSIESRSSADRCGSLQVGDRVIAINDRAPPVLDTVQSLETLVADSTVTLATEFPVAHTVMPTSGIFTVRLANNKVAGLGITISGCSHYQGSMTISSIRAGSVAHRCGSLSPGDRILSINNHCLADYSLDDALSILHSTQDIVTLVIQKGSHAENIADDVMGYSSPEIPSADSAVESWDSLHEQSPPSAQSNQQLYKSESATVKRKCDPTTLQCGAGWSDTGLQSTNSLNTVQSDADETCSSIRLSESVINEYNSQLQNQHKYAPPSPPCPLQVNYQHRNNTLPNHRRTSSIGLRYQDSIQANLLSSPRRCRRGFHLLEDEASNFPLQEEVKINHPEVTFDTFFKRVAGTNDDLMEDYEKSSGHVFQVTLYKDPVYEDFGFSVSDGLYERGVYINRIRRGGPADVTRLLQPFDRILKVNETKTEELDCCLTVPLVAAAGDTLHLTVSRGHYGQAEHKDQLGPAVPWIDGESSSPCPSATKTPAVTKTL